MATGLTHDQIIQMGLDENKLPSEYYRSDTGGANNSGNTIQRAIQLQQEANKPAIQSLQASIPEVQKSITTRQEQLKAEADPLKQRYQSLLSEIKGSQKTAENRQTVVTSNELGKRGILGSSTLAGQELTNALNPITAQYTGLYKTTALDQEKALKDLQDEITNLGLTGVEKQRAIANAIAQLQAGAASAGITQGYAQENAVADSAAKLAEQKRLDDAAALQKLIYENISLPESKYAINKPYYKSDTTNENDPFGLLG